MKRRLDLQELAQITYQGLKARGIEVTLSGGACVSIFTENAYQSGDLDFIRQMNVGFASVSEAMTELGFRREGRHFARIQGDGIVYAWLAAFAITHGMILASHDKAFARFAPELEWIAPLSPSATA